ncbi:hypothetical protein [Bacillus sp. Marseille-Q1617]|uniref:hypothetical protein n=1 Tax=Bacillus sp. Marseille-Q1617 TaxID=2736887 RepID=UPI00158D9F9B|nr:hypothetical protein [Bacillus sp. Marseille-Q1617]
MDRYNEIMENVQKRYPNLTVVSLEQELDSYARSNVFLTVKAPIHVIGKLITLASGKNRLLATSFSIEEDKIRFKSFNVADMYPLLDTITK